MKKTYLSFGGRLTLFCMPATIERKLDLEDIFYGPGTSTLVKLPVVIGGKTTGKLGVRNLKLHNRSLLCKWLWRDNRGSEETWLSILDVIYGEKDGWKQNPTQLKNGGGTGADL